MLIGIGPIVVAILAGLVLREGFPRSLLVGCGVAFVGVVVIGVATSEGGSSTAGVVLCVVAACSYAVAVILQKSVIGRLTALQTTLFCCVIAAVACLPFAWQLVRELGDAPGGAIAWTVYLGVFPTAIGFTTWAFALARTDAGKLGATTYLVPPHLDPAGLADPVREPTGPRAAGRRAVPGRSRRHPPRRALERELAVTDHHLAQADESCGVGSRGNRTRTRVRRESDGAAGLRLGCNQRVGSSC